MAPLTTAMGTARPHREQLPLASGAHRQRIVFLPAIVAVGHLGWQLGADFGNGFFQLLEGIWELEAFCSSLAKLSSCNWIN